METMKKVLIFASQAALASELVSGAGAYGDEVILVYCGKEDHEFSADKIYRIRLSEHDTALGILDWAGSFVSEAKPGLVLAENSRDGRLLAARLASVLGTSVMTDVSGVEKQDGDIITRRFIYGGKAIMKERRSGAAVICLGSGVLAPCGADGKAPGEVTEVSIEAPARIKLRSRSEKTVQSTNLDKAKIVVGVGRGVKEEENLRLVEELASLLGAEIACTRPVSEELHWYPRERYIGVSGITIKPDVYIAIGISGQIQHTIGISESGTIVAINRDKDAPIFAQADFGIVGDACDVMQKICAGLKKPMDV